MNELDLKTIEAAQKKAQGAFKAIFDHYGPMIWRVAMRTTNGDAELSEEIVQEVFVKVFRALPGFRQQAAFSTWLHRIAYTTTMTSLSKRQRDRNRFIEYDDEARGSAQQPSADLHEEVERILRNLTPQERFLLVAREVDGVSYEDLAEITGSSCGALRTRLHRLKETIRQGGGYESLPTESA
jgi:RNA polymerase sigma-70 factor (ECF subfamily)